MPSHRFHPKSSRFFCGGGAQDLDHPVCTYFAFSVFHLFFYFRFLCLSMSFYFSCVLIYTFYFNLLCVSKNVNLVVAEFFAMPDIYLSYSRKKFHREKKASQWALIPPFFMFLFMEKL